MANKDYRTTLQEISSDLDSIIEETAGTELDPVAIFEKLFCTRRKFALVYPSIPYEEARGYMGRFRLTDELVRDYFNIQRWKENDSWETEK